jgi:hypothetical protein
MNYIRFVLSTVVMTIFIASSNCIARADALSYTKRAMRILDRVAEASSTQHIKPAIRVGDIPSIGLWDPQRRIIELDSGLFQIADQFGSKADAMLAYVIGHEFAHYVRGHEFSQKFQHLFGSFASVHDINTQVSQRFIGKQQESESDYFGMYYSMLAGFEISMNDYRAFWSAMEDRYGENNGEGVHPVREERQEIANTVFNEIKGLTYIHEVANVALLSGQYLEAAVLYEHVSKDVNIPSVSWNELIARFLFLQEVSKKELIDPKVLRSQHVSEFRYRSSDLNVRLDIEQLLYRCQALLDNISRSGFNLKRTEQLQRLVDTYQESQTCSLCKADNICRAHFRIAQEIEKEFEAEKYLAGDGINVDEGKLTRKEMLNVSNIIDEHTNVNKYEIIPVSLGSARYVTFENNGVRFIRLYYRAPRSRTDGRIDVAVEECGNCELPLLLQQDNVTIQVVTGKRIRAAQFVD